MSHKGPMDEEVKRIQATVAEISTKIKEAAQKEDEKTKALLLEEVKKIQALVTDVEGIIAGVSSKKPKV